MSQLFNVRLLPSDLTIQCPAGRTVLDVAQEAGIGLPHSCRGGHCGSCRARLLAGEVDYRFGPPLGLSVQDIADGHVLLCQARPRSDLTIEVNPVASRAQAQIKTLPCRVMKRVPLAPDVMQLVLRLPAVEPLEFQAGQYVDILLDGGRRRSFSIASPPGMAQEIELHVRRTAGGLFSERLFGAPEEAGTDGEELSRVVQPGTLLRIEGPLGRFLYDEAPAGPPVIFIAGGTGFAPIQSMVAQVLAQDDGRPLHLYWGARTALELYREAFIRELVCLHPRLRFQAVLSQVVAAPPPYRTGWVHQAVLDDFPDLTGLPVYAAGPPPLIQAIRDSFPARGAQAAQLHFDVFDYAVDPVRRA